MGENCAARNAERQGSTELKFSTVIFINVLSKVFFYISVFIMLIIKFSGMHLRVASDIKSH